MVRTTPSTTWSFSLSFLRLKQRQKVGWELEVCGLVPFEAIEKQFDFVITLADTMHLHLLAAGSCGLDVIEELPKQEIVFLIDLVQQPKQEVGLVWVPHQAVDDSSMFQHKLCC